MKICEYDNIQCPYCGEKEKLTDAGFVSLDLKEPQIPTASLGPWHYIRCGSCSGEFTIPCAD